MQPSPVTKNRRKGQSLVEAMMALSMLMVGFLGILTLLSRSFFLNRVTANDLTATYLASEGIELAKNLIDHDVYAFLATPPQGTGWRTTFGNSGGDFQLDYTTCSNGAACTPPSYNPAARLHFDPTSHRYGYVGSVTTPYVRLIRITVPNANEIVVNAIVTWQTGTLASQSVNLEDHFYNWHP